MEVEQPPAVDGRRARRERSRAAVIDAVFALVAEGKVPPPVEQLAERSGVSVSSIFRMFDGLDDMRTQAFEQFQERYSHLFRIEIDDCSSRAERIDQLVRSRCQLYSEAGPLMQLARQRAIEHEPIAERVEAQRAELSKQVQRCLRVEVATLTPVEAANLVAVIDATTSPEAFDLLGAAHERTRRQIEHTWRRSVASLVAAWCDTPHPSRKEPTS